MGKRFVNEDGFSAQPILQEFVSLVTRHWRAIAHTLESGQVFTPLLLEDERGVVYGNDWANGFLRGIALWAHLLHDDEHGGALVPILALAHEHDPDPEMRSYEQPVSAELREKLLVGMAAGAMKTYRYFRESR